VICLILVIALIKPVGFYKGVLLNHVHQVNQTNHSSDRGFGCFGLGMEAENPEGGLATEDL